MLLEKLTSREVAGELIDAIKANNSFTSIATINAALTGKLVRRLHLDPLLWLLKKAYLVVVCNFNDGEPPRSSNVLITGIPFNDSKEFKTWNFVNT